ncbi:MAG TPA: DNA polymerase III subunit delta [Bacteroidia bacterium]|nr:DNA polymerase III subunit delta [Bacteroidia bacterium]
MKEIDNILLDLKRRIFKPVYFLSGEEPYYIDQVSDYLENHVLEPEEKEFNQIIVYGKDSSLSQVVSLARQFPMMGEHIVLIVKEAQHFRELNRTVKEDDDTEIEELEEPAAVQQFLDYLENPQPSTILLFCYKYKKLDKRSAIAKALIKRHVFVETKALYDNQLPDWISNYVKSKNYSIGPKTAFLIAESLGSDLSKISNEIHKLIINLKEGSEISMDLVQQLIGISKEFNVFELQKAIAQRDILKANRIIQYFGNNEKDNPSQLVLAQLHSYFTKVMKYHFLPDKSKMAAANVLGVNPYFVDDYARAAGVYPVPKIKHIFTYLKEADLRSKGVDYPNTLYADILKELLFKMLH